MDLGNSVTKVEHEGNFFSFDSRIEPTTGSWGSHEMTLEFKDKTYIVGEGEYEVENNKYMKSYNIPLILAGIGRAMGRSKSATITLALGLPIAQFKEHREEFIDSLREGLGNPKAKDSKERKVSEFYFNGEKKRILIEDIYVFAEGLGAFVALGLTEGIMIDAGSKTTDIFFFQKGVLKPITEYKGVLDIYNSVARALSNKFGCDYDIEEIPGIIEAGCVYEYGEPKDISDCLEEAKKIVRKIFTTLKLNYAINKYPVYLTGGGAHFFGDKMKEKIPNLAISEDLYLNVKGYKILLNKKLNG